MVPALLAAEITARLGRDPGDIYRDLTHEFGEPAYDRVEAPATPEHKARLAQLCFGGGTVAARDAVRANTTGETMSTPTLEQQWATLHFGAVQVKTRGEQHLFEVEVCHDND